MLKILSDLIFSRTNQIRICCFHFGRCGSTLLGNMLAGHPQLDWKGEIFHAFHERENRDEVIEPFSVIQGLLAESSFRNFGFETKFQHLDCNGLNVELEAYVSSLKDLGFEKLMIIVRRNYLRQAISVARGQATGEWHVSSTDPKPEFRPIEFDIENVSLGGVNRSMIDCFDFLDRQYEFAEETFHRMGLDFLKIQYEDDLENDPISGYRKSLSWLGLRFSKPQISVRRLECRPLAHAVSNFSKVRDCLAGTKYEWMCSGKE